MTGKAGFFNFSLHKILSPEQSTLDQARIKLLYYGMLLVSGFLAVLLASVIIQQQVVLTVTASVLLACVLVLFKYFTYRSNWQFISHALLAAGTVSNLFNTYVSLQSVNIITIQVVLLVVVFSFYMLGQSWGRFYSLANILPVLAFMVLEHQTNYIIDFKPEKLDTITTFISVIANFTVLIFIHNNFNNAFIANLRKFKESNDEQAGLNVKLESAINKAEKSSQAKSEFLSTMSHEIRTPLNAVIGMTNLMLMNNPRHDQKENLDILKFSATNLLAIVNDVLDFNKIESGRVVFENIRFNMQELMQSICGGFIIKAEEKGLIFKVEVDSKLKNRILIGDPTRITQIIFNLISNAIKFTHQGNIWVKVTCVEDRHDNYTVLFSVRDTGIGIASDNLGVIFEPFAQESVTTTRQYGGTGLGLAIVKRLLELQGLQMNVKSKQGVGSEFSFNMEFTVATDIVAEKTEVPQLLPDEDDLEHLQILIAEDNMVNVMLMKKLLSKWNIVPGIAENGELAVRMLQYGNFDIVLMDLQMPVMNGFEAAMEIRRLADPKKAATPIIALTASALFDIKEKVYASGMNDYISKPFKPEELFEKIQSLLDKQLPQIGIAG